MKVRIEVVGAKVSERQWTPREVPEGIFTAERWRTNDEVSHASQGVYARYGNVIYYVGTPGGSIALNMLAEITEPKDTYHFRHVEAFPNSALVLRK